MPSVFTIAAPFGDDEPRKCKWTTNPRTGCKIKLCKESNGRWKFQAGTSQCPLTGGRKRNRRKRRRSK